MLFSLLLLYSAFINRDKLSLVLRDTNEMITKCLTRKYREDTHFMQGHSVLVSSLFNLNHRINHVFPSAVSPEQDMNPFSGR